MTMRNRKTVITAFILVAVMVMAIGFAAMADDLYITGSANITAENAETAFGEDIYFTKAVMSADRGTASIGPDDSGDAADKVTITVNENALKGKGDSVICTIELSNMGDVDAWVNLDSIVENSEYFAVTTNWTTSTLALPAGGHVDIIVNISCTKTPQTAVATTFSITYTATDYDPTAVVD